MRRILFTIIILLIIASIGVPFYLGIKAEKSYSEFLKKIEDSGLFKIESSNYKRGIFSSTAHTKSSIKNDTKKIIINISDRIYHGPLDYRSIVRGKLELEPFLATANSDIQTDIPVTTSQGDTKIITINMSGNTFINLNRTVKSKIIVPKYKFIKSDKNLIADWSGLELVFNYDMRKKLLSSTIISKSLSIEDEASKLTVGEINGKSNAIGHGELFSSMTGEYEINVEKLQYISTSGNMEVNDISFSGYSKNDKGKLNSGLKIASDNININKDLFGPFLAEIELKNIDYKSYINLQRVTQSSNDNTNTLYPSDDLIRILPELLKHSPSLEISKFNLDSNRGKIKAHARLLIKGDNPKLLQNILLIGNAIEAEVNASISKDLIVYLDDHKPIITLQEHDSKDISDSSYSTKIQELLDSNIISSNTESFVFKAGLKNGNITVNDRPLEISPMLLNLR